MSNKFHFRLATLLRLRETNRDQRRAALAEAQRSNEVLADRLERLKIEQEDMHEESRKAAGPGTVDVDQLIETARYAGMLQIRHEELRREHETMATEIDRRRQALLAADRDVHVLEKLRERRSQQHRRDEERQTAKQLDEAALQTAGR